MNDCQVDGVLITDKNSVAIPDDVLHVVAAGTAKSSTTGHRIDGFDVTGLHVTGDPDGPWDSFQARTRGSRV